MALIFESHGNTIPNMSTTTNKNRCVTCNKENAITKCGGCLQDFCFNDFGNHRQELDKQLDEIETNCDLIRQSLSEQTFQLKNDLLIQEINQWEQELINKIKQIAEEAKQSVLKYPNEINIKIEVELNKLTNQLRQNRQENNFFEIDLNRWKEELRILEEEMTKPSNIIIRQDSTTFINKIYVDISTTLSIPNISINAKWIKNGITVAGGNGKGNESNQLSSPYGVYVDDEQTVYVADYSNHCIVEWKSGAKNGQVVAGGKGAGDRNDQLNGPRNVIVDKENDCLIISDYGNKRVVKWPRRNGTIGETIISNVACWSLLKDRDGYLYVSDRDKHEVRRWKIGDANGKLVAGGNQQGNRRDQLNGPFYIFIDEEHSLYISEYYNHRVMKWVEGAKEGVLVAGTQSQGNDLTQLSGPCGVVVDHLGTVYVAEWNNHRVTCWPKGATRGCVVVGGNGQGEKANQFSSPCDLSLDRQNNLYVVDSQNNRVQKFNIDSS